VGKDNIRGRGKGEGLLTFFTLYYKYLLTAVAEVTRIKYLFITSLL